MVTAQSLLFIVQHTWNQSHQRPPHYLLLVIPEEWAEQPSTNASFAMKNLWILFYICVVICVCAMSVLFNSGEVEVVDNVPFVEHPSETSYVHTDRDDAILMLKYLPSLSRKMLKPHGECLVITNECSYQSDKFELPHTSKCSGQIIIIIMIILI